MSDHHDALAQAVARALSGKDAHVESRQAVADLDWKTAGARLQGAPHSIFQILNHVIYWQEWGASTLAGGKPRIPQHAAGSWPGEVSPASAEEWAETVARFNSGLDDLDRLISQEDFYAQIGKRSRLDIFQIVASHNSYHIGQVVLLRQQLGTWPPPAGGLTW